MIDKIDRPSLIKDGFGKLVFLLFSGDPPPFELEVGIKIIRPEGLLAPDYRALQEAISKLERGNVRVKFTTERREG